MTTPDRSTTMPIPPDGYFALAVGAMLLLEWIAPLHWLPERALLAPATLIGLVLAAAGLALEIAAARALAGADTTIRPNGAPLALVTRGVFALSRNPFYCGIVLLLAGGSIAASLDWALLLVPAFWLALDRFVVPVEERRLARAFGADWPAYAAATPRWLWK